MPRACVRDEAHCAGRSSGANARCATGKKPTAHPLSKAGGRVDVMRKPSFVPRLGRPRRGGNHSSRTIIADRLEQPTRRLGRVTLCDLAVARLPMRPCSRWGLPCRSRYRARGGLLPRRFTLTLRETHATRRAVCFLWHSPRRFRHRALPGILLYGARTFLPLRGLPLPRPAIACAASTAHCSHFRPSDAMRGLWSRP